MLSSSSCWPACGQFRNVQSGLESGGLLAPSSTRDASGVNDWRSWHEAYDDPASSLARRLQVVRRRLDEVLDLVASRAPRLLALCAGDARDVIPVLAARADGGQVEAVLVELDERLATWAANAADSAGLERVVVRHGDAGDPSSFRDVVPVHVLMLCGVFGNVSQATVADIARAVPAMVDAGGYVMWTRGGGRPIDRRPEVRRLFIEAGMPEVSFDGEPEPYGVGVNMVTDRRGTVRAGRLFTFGGAARS